jgi:hypothetical protein
MSLSNLGPKPVPVKRRRYHYYSNNINLLVIVLIFAFLLSSITEPVFSFDMIYNRLPVIIKPRK